MDQPPRGLCRTSTFAGTDDRQARAAAGFSGHSDPADRCNSEAAHADFFRELLAGVDAATLPYGIADGGVGRGGLQEAVCPLDPGLASRLRERAQAAGVGRAALWHLAWALVLARLSGRDDVVFGTVLPGRGPRVAWGGEAMGLASECFPVRIRVDEARADEGLRTTQAQLARLLRHADAPPAIVQRGWDGIPGKPALGAILDCRFGPAARAVGGADPAPGDASHPLSVVVDDDDDGIRVSARVRAPGDPRRLCAQWVQALEGLADALERSPGMPLRDVDVLPPSERRELLEEWNRTESPFPRGRCLHEMFEEQAARTPDAEAVVCGDLVLTYAELDARSNQLARHLVARGAGAGARVGLCVGRSAAMLVGMLAVSKAGGAYVPLDPELPDARLHLLLADSGPALVLVSSGLEGRLPPGTPAELVDEEGRCGDASGLGTGALLDGERLGRPDASLPAYVIHTSGSTGTPKGVVVAHRSAVNHMVWMAREYPMGLGDRVLARTSMGFDASAWELWLPLVTGASACIVPSALSRDPAALVATMDAAGVTVAQFVPSMIPELLAAGGVRPWAIRLVFAGGEPLGRPLADALTAAWAVPVVNLYGPTEATIQATHWVHQPEVPGPEVVPIGRPIANARAYVLDARGRPAPVGVPGELHLGGEVLALGYLGKPELTAERFVRDPFVAGDGARMYRTGDRVRWLPDGVLEFLGRLDLQVKLRGFRIEPGEVESALGRIPSVAQAVVVVREDRPGDPRLVAYVVPRRGGAVPTPETLRARLAAVLPAHMVPSAFVLLDALPTTASGKVDRRSLPAPGAGTPRPAATGGLPRTAIEERITALWCETLGLAAAGVRDGFFEVGGNSLTAMRLVARIRKAFSVELPVRALFEQPTVAGLASRVEQALRRGLPAEEPSPRKEAAATREVPLSYAQERLWFLDRLGRGSLNYIVGERMSIDGPLDAAALGRALREIVRRHLPLRTACVEEGGVPRGRVLDEAGFAMQVDDLRGLRGAEREAEVRRRVDAVVGAEFDLARDFMFRAHLLQFGDTEHELVLAWHHIAWDGWSAGVFRRELSALYDAGLRGEPSPLPELAVAYPDHAAWQREWMQGALLGEQLDHWRRRLEGAPALLELPTDFPRPAVAGQAGGVVPVALDPGLVQQVAGMARREGATPFMVLLAAWQALLSRHSGQEDVVVGAPIAGRTRAESEGLVGMFANTLVLRTDLSGNPSFRELLQRVRETTLEAFAHQDLPFEKLVEVLQPERKLGHSPVFQAAFAFLNTPDDDPPLTGLSVRRRSQGNATAKFDLTLMLVERGDRISGSIEYRSDLFEPATAGRMAEHLAVLLAAAVADPGRAVGELPLMTDAERARVLEEWNGTAAPFPSDVGVQQTFGEQARRSPGSVAVETGGEGVTYAVLDARAGAIAARLRAAGVRRGSRVALHLERSAELVAAVLGVLKAGGCYVPLPAEYPVSRLRYMVEDSGARCVVARGPLPDGLLPDGCAVVDLDAAGGPGPGEDGPVEQAGPEDPAYVMYTSGSTGEPKGVVVPHRAIHRLVFGQRFAGFGPGMRTLLLAPPAFDASTLEMWGPLLHGGTCVVYPERHVVLERLERTLREGRVNCLWLTAALFNHVVDLRPSVLEGVAHVLTGGEALSVPHVGQALRRFPGMRLTNGYGPTECTTFACTHEVGAGERFPRGNVPIGRPIANTRALVLDARGEPVPVGVPGELHLGGAGLALGYLGREALTAERFVGDRFGAPGARLYRTGDRVRWLADGTLEYLGRLDRQVKLRGFRIEPGEIEAVLSRHGSVLQAAVLAREDRPGEMRLVAYVVARPGGAEDAEALRAHLRAALPEHMVPSAFVFLPSLPVTANGKLDRAALPAPAAARRPAGAGVPATRAEEQLAGIWRQVLRAEAVGVDDNFFALGGHSLLAMRVVARIRETLGVEVPVRTLFEAPTVGQLAVRVEDLRRAGMATGRPPLVPVPRTGPLRLSFAQERLWFLDQFEGGSTEYHIPYGYRLRGPVDVAALEAALRGVVRRQEALRTVCVRSEGPALARVLPADGFRMAFDDLAGAGVDPAAAEAEARRRTEEEVLRPFDLSADHLLRARLMRLAEDDHVLLLTLHHIAADGWSVEVFVRELSALYAACLRGEASPLPDLALGYLDHAAWQREWLRGAELEAQFEYWRGRLKGIPELTCPPTDHPRPDVAGKDGAQVDLELDARQSAALEAMAQREGVTPFMVLLAGWQALLRGLCGQDDVVVGTPVAGRERAEVEQVVGFFANTLALRVDLSGNPTFRELLGRVRETTLGALAHQEIPFGKLVEELRPPRSLAHTPLFQVVFAFQNETSEALSLPGLSATRWETPSPTAKFDLALMLWSRGGRIAGMLEYRTDLFEAATIRGWVERFVALIDVAVADPSRRLAALAPSATAGTPVPDVPSVARTEAAPVTVSAGAAGESPESLVEALMSDLWRRLLGVERVGLDENFFDLGGHSLLSLQLVEQAERLFGVRLPPRELFVEPTVRGLSRKVWEELVRPGRIATHPPDQRLIPLQAEGGRPPLFVFPGGYGDESELISQAWMCRRHLGTSQPVYALLSTGVDATRPACRTLAREAAGCLGEMRRVCPGGPWHLVGLCVGGNLAFEVARQAQAAGEEVRMLAMADCWLPRAGEYWRRCMDDPHRGLRQWVMNTLYRDLPWARPLLSSRGRRRLLRSWFGRGVGRDVPVVSGVDKEQEWRAFQHGEAVLRRQFTPPRGKFRGRIDVLTSTEFRGSPRILEWGGHATGGAEVLVLPGNHSTYLVEGAPQIAALYRRRIDAR